MEAGGARLEKKRRHSLASARLWPCTEGVILSIGSRAQTVAGRASNFKARFSHPPLACKALAAAAARPSVAWEEAEAAGQGGSAAQTSELRAGAFDGSQKRTCVSE